MVLEVCPTPGDSWTISKPWGRMSSAGRRRKSQQLGRPERAAAENDLAPRGGELLRSVLQEFDADSTFAFEADPDGAGAGQNRQIRVAFPSPG